MFEDSFQTLQETGRPVHSILDSHLLPDFGEFLEDHQEPCQVHHVEDELCASYWLGL